MFFSQSRASRRRTDQLLVSRALVCGSLGVAGRLFDVRAACHSRPPFQVLLL